MPGVARIGVDSAGGTIVGNLAPSVRVDGAPVAVRGAVVEGHGPGEHGGPVMVGASATVFAAGHPICRAGDEASCGHPATGSGDVFAG